MSESADINHPEPDRGDDRVIPFHLNEKQVRGRVVRLGTVADDIVSRHDVPVAVQNLLAETVALTSMVATALKFDGIFTLQTQGDGPVNMLVGDVRNGGDLRGLARLKDDATPGDAPDTGDGSVQALLGAGSMAFTVDPAGDANRYQGLVALDGSSIATCAEHFFSQSEQIPTYIQLAAGRGPDGRWRAGGLMLQAMPGARPDEPQEADWTYALALANTVKPGELIDAGLDGPQLLYRLFHEDGVWIHDAQPLTDRCTCGDGRIFDVLKSMPADEVRDLANDDRIEAACQFCNRIHTINLSELEKQG